MALDTGTAEHLPYFIGALVVAVTGLVSVLKGYSWLLSEIRSAIGEALSHHQEVEATCHKSIEDRLAAIEEKIERLEERVAHLIDRP